MYDMFAAINLYSPWFWLPAGFVLIGSLAIAGIGRRHAVMHLLIMTVLVAVTHRAGMEYIALPGGFELRVDWWRAGLLILLVAEIIQLRIDTATGSFPNLFGLAYLMLAALAAGFADLSAHFPLAEFIVDRIAWEFSSFADLPFPSDLMGRLHPYEGTASQINWAPLIRESAMAFLVITILHSFTFWFCLTIHRSSGWPKYWPAVRDRVSISAMWTGGARRNWYIPALILLVWHAWIQVEQGTGPAGNVILITGMPVFLGHLIVLLFFMFRGNAKSIRRAVLAEVTEDDRLCDNCSYAQRGTPGDRCPECGTPIDAKAPPAFGFRRPQSRVRRTWLATRPAILTLTLLSLPAWLSPVLWQVPVEFRKLVPAAIRPTGYVAGVPRPRPIRFPGIRRFQLPTQSLPEIPVRLDAVTTIDRQNHERVVIVPKLQWSEADKSDLVILHIGHWMDARFDPAHAPSYYEQRIAYKFKRAAGLKRIWTQYEHIRMGNVNFSTVIRQTERLRTGYEFRIILHDTTTTVSSTMRSQYDGDLCWLAE